MLTRPRLTLLAPLLALLLVAPCVAAAPATAAPRRDLWLVAPSSADLRSVATAAGLRAMRARGINAVLADARLLAPAGERRLRANARAAGLPVVRLTRSGRACAAAALRCARLLTRTASVRREVRAGRLVARSAPRAATLRALRALRGHGRVIGVLPLRGRATSHWSAAIAAAKGSMLVELAVRPVGAVGRRELPRFLQVLSRALAAGGHAAPGPEPGAGGRPEPSTPGSPGAPGGGGGLLPVAPAAPPLPPASVFLAPTGSDTAPCTASAPCRSFSRGYRVAQPGAVVEVAGGIYHDTELGPDATKTSAWDVVFRPAPGATVRLDATTFTVTASHVELRDIATTEWWVETPAQDVTMRNVDTDDFVIVSNPTGAPKDISVLGGDVGPKADGYSVVGTNGLNMDAVPQDVLIDGVRFHDYTLSPGSDAHVECLQVWGGDGLTVRNSTFDTCHVFDILFNVEQGVPTPTNITVENNFFQCCGAGDNYSVRFSDTHGEQWNDVLFRNNSTNRKISLGTAAPYRDVQVIGNIAPHVDGTPPGVTFDYNIWYSGGTRIGAHDQLAPSGFADEAAGDFHLKPGAAAIDHGGPSGPARDIDGDGRPLGGGFDAGADEAG